MVGGILGAMAAGLIPGVGPIIGAGMLIATVGGAVGGAVAGTLLGALAGLGIPEQEARYYEGEFLSGRTLVTVKAEANEAEAESILQSHGAYNMQSRRPAEVISEVGSETDQPADTSKGSRREDTGNT